VTHSALYEGRVFHRRLEPRPHEFSYRLALLYLDLDELPHLFASRWLWSASRRNVAWFRRADYMGPPEQPLRVALLQRVELALGRKVEGAVRVLTQLRTLGHTFNPVTFYYCFDLHDELEAIAAEITNTPWGERHSYVLDVQEAHGPGPLRWRFAKDFHVSPFFGRELDYEWSFGAPGERLEVQMTNLDSGRPVFHAGLECQRREITGRSLSALLLRYPLQSLRIHAAIYWQAARLWSKRAPFHVHPAKRVKTLDTQTRA
jgi:DUF1365 family protein